MELVDVCKCLAFLCHSRYKISHSIRPVFKFLIFQIFFFYLLESMIADKRAPDGTFHFEYSRSAIYYLFPTWNLQGPRLSSTYAKFMHLNQSVVPQKSFLYVIINCIPNFFPSLWILSLKICRVASSRKRRSLVPCHNLYRLRILFY